MHGTARLSDCRRYRYTLTRLWDDEAQRRVCWIMLNPSTADADQDDATIRRCTAFSTSWGYGSLIVVNLWPLRATNPNDLRPFVAWDKSQDWHARDQIYYVNLPIVLEAAHESAIAIAAWGAQANRLDCGYVDHVVEELTHGDCPAGWAGLFCLGRTKDGSPRHPLYAKGDLQPVPFSAPEGM